MPYKSIEDARARGRRYYQTHRTSNIAYRARGYGKTKTRKEIARNRDLRVRAHIKNFLKEIKESAPCMDCHLFWPAPVMEFDHVRGVKSYNISQMRRHTLTRICQEIDKCDLVCSNCHKLRHIARDSNRNYKNQ